MRRIFISHSSRDNAIAKSLKDRLQQQGYHSLFLDFDPSEGIPAGRDWERELYQRILTSQAMIVICSRTSMASRWCFMEITHARALGKPLFALKIDDCTLDGVLTDRQAVDLASEGDTAYERLFRGMHAAGLDPKNNFQWDQERPLYPGLLAFQEEDAAIFFGRGDEITQGLELLNRVHRLGEPGLVMVLGASGTGKSSLVRAGLVPRLRRDAEHWIVIDPFRPRTNALQELAIVIDKGEWSNLTGSFRGSTDPDALVNLVRSIRSQSTHPGAKVLLVIDQFEELLGVNDNTIFLHQLRRVADLNDSPAIILATMRSDFLDRLQNSQPLLDMPYAVLSLGQMSESDIIEIIEEPAKGSDLQLEQQLVKALVTDAGIPPTLPLLAFTLRELWERYGKDGNLTLDEYRGKLGGIQQVVGKAADDVLTSNRVTPQQEKSLRAVFLSLMTITDDGRYARRTVYWKDVPAEVEALVKRFVEARLLVSGTNGAEETIEVAHECIFDSWKQLRDWIAENREVLQMRHEIERVSRSWNSERPKDLLWRGARVSRAQELLAGGRLQLDDAGRRFITASANAQKDRRRTIIIAVLAFGVIATVLAIIAFINFRRADANATLADERAKVSEVDRLKALSAQNFAEHERVRARAQIDSVPADEKNALLAIAPKYLAQSKRYEDEAKRLQKLLDNWRNDKGIQNVVFNDQFTLEVFRAQTGTAFLVHYGTPDSPRYILVDGGFQKTYRDHIKPRLATLAAPGKTPWLSHVIATQTDMQHLEGLIYLIEDLQQQTGQKKSVNIGTLWSNAFVPGPPEMADRLVAMQRKGRLVAGAKKLYLPVNAPFGHMIAAPEAGAARVNINEHMSITVLSPRVQWLREFADYWLRDWRRRAEDRDSSQHLLEALSDYSILETFADPKIELLPSPLEIIDPHNERARDISPVNLGSFVLMLEMHNKRILLTADARSNVILSALAQAGYTNEKGAMELDVLVMPHMGSDRNVSIDFFKRVKARYYVFSADGTYDNPDPKTFKMLFEARRDDPRPFAICLSYAPEEYKNNYPLDELCSILTRERYAGTPFSIITSKKEQGSFGIDLLRDVKLVDKGRIDSVCNLK